MKDRSRISQRLQSTLSRLIDTEEMRPERIALDLGMSCNSVHSWKSGRRFPSMPVIRQIEQLYRVKIL